MRSRSVVSSRCLSRVSECRYSDSAAREGTAVESEDDPKVRAMAMSSFAGKGFASVDWAPWPFARPVALPSTPSLRECSAADCVHSTSCTKESPIDVTATSIALYL